MTETFNKERVVEIIETRSRRIANLYLDAGYDLAHVGTVHYRRSGDNKTQAGVEYVLVRSASTQALEIQAAIDAAADQRSEPLRDVWPPSVRTIQANMLLPAERRALDASPVPYWVERIENT